MLSLPVGSNVKQNPFLTRKNNKYFNQNLLIQSSFFHRILYFIIAVVVINDSERDARQCMHKLGNTRPEISFSPFDEVSNLVVMSKESGLFAVSPLRRRRHRVLRPSSGSMHPKGCKHSWRFIVASLSTHTFPLHLIPIIHISRKRSTLAFSLCITEHLRIQHRICSHSII